MSEQSTANPAASPAPERGYLALEEELTGGLSDAERHAVRLYKALLDGYNTRDGVGLMRGKNRHGKLQSEVEMAANREFRPGGTLKHFYSKLSEAMLWKGEPTRVVRAVMEVLRPPEGADDRQVLRALAGYSQMVAGVARVWHDEEKEGRREERRALEEDWRAVQEARAGQSPFGEPDGEKRGLEREGDRDAL